MNQILIVYKAVDAFGESVPANITIMINSCGQADKTFTVGNCVGVKRSVSMFTSFTTPG